MTDIQAAIGIEQLKKLDWIVTERRKVAATYRNGLKDISCFRLPKEQKGDRSNYQSYPIYVKKECKWSRDQIMNMLLTKGITTRRGIMTCHREKAYQRLFSFNKLPVSEDMSDRSFLIPLFVPMIENDINWMIKSIIMLSRKTLPFAGK